MNKEDSKQENGKPGFWNRQSDKVTKKTKSVVGYEAIKDGYDAIVEYGSVLNPFKKKKKRNVESFEDSYDKHGMSEEGLRSIYKILIYKFYAAVTMTILVLLWMSYLAYDGRLSTFLAAIGVLAVAIAVSVTTSFKLHQIHVREWCSFGQWMNRNGSLWPKPWKTPDTVVYDRRKK